MDDASGFYPPSEWDPYPHILHCDSGVPKGLRRAHEPHFMSMSSALIDEIGEYPIEFICGGWPRKVIDIEDYR